MSIYTFANNLYNELLIKGQEMHPSVNVARIPLKFSRQMTRCGGNFKFTYSGKAVEIALSDVLMNMHGEEFVTEVLTHEFAHYMTHLVHGMNVQPHGIEWKRMMRSLGADPKRTHDFATVSNKSQYTYTLDNGYTVTVGKVRHNKIQRGATYTVRGQGRLTATHYVGANKPQPLPKAPRTTKPKATRTRKPFNGQSKATVARQLIRSWINMGITKDQALSRGALVTEMYHKAGMNNMGQARGYIRDQWSKA